VVLQQYYWLSKPTCACKTYTTVGTAAAMTLLPVQLPSSIYRLKISIQFEKDKVQEVEIVPLCPSVH
jgi:hypothetical protein